MLIVHVMQGHYQSYECYAHFYPTIDSHLACQAINGEKIVTLRHRISLV